MNNIWGCNPSKCNSNFTNPCLNSVIKPWSTTGSLYGTKIKRTCRFNNNNTLKTSCTGECSPWRIWNWKSCKTSETSCGAGKKDSVSLTKENACEKSLLSGAIQNIQHGKKRNCWTAVENKVCWKCENGYTFDKTTHSCKKWNSCNNASAGFPYCFDIDFNK